MALVETYPPPDLDDLPPLRTGDRMDRAEFERRYDAAPEIRAELIEGIVYVSSPVRVSVHGEPHAMMVTWAGVYRAATPGVRFADNASVRLDKRNMPQPDVMLFIPRELGGQSTEDQDQYLDGAPEIAIEIASASVDYDLHQKLEAYRRNGVREYLIWRVLDREFDWFSLRSGAYQRVEASPDGLIKSEVMPGLWLKPAALIDGDFPALLAALQQGIASPEHEAFRARLAAAAGEQK